MHPYVKQLMILMLAIGSVGCQRAMSAHDPIQWTGSDQTTAPATDATSGTTATAVAFPIPEDVVPAICSTYRFAIGDRLAIEFIGHVNDGDVLVDAAGMISVGRIKDLPARGRTVADVRDDLQLRAREWYRGAQVSVHVAEVVGHRYTLLGKVVDKGSYAYDRPLRILDVLARARGIEVGLQDGQTVEIADFDHAMLLRDGKVLPLDFRRLIQEGDHRYNIHVHPGDHFYFPSSVTATVQVLGAVRQPGSQPYVTGMHLTGVLARRGGLQEHAWRQRILVVRGGVNTPRVYQVDHQAILAGTIPGFRIKPGDIVHVADRPQHDLQRWLNIMLQAAASVVGGRVGGDVAREVLR